MLKRIRVCWCLLRENCIPETNAGYESESLVIFHNEVKSVVLLVLFVYCLCMYWPVLFP
jgi:hypothetical protein